MFEPVLTLGIERAPGRFHCLQVPETKKSDIRSSRSRFPDRSKRRTRRVSANPVRDACIRREQKFVKRTCVKSKRKEDETKRATHMTVQCHHLSTTPHDHCCRAGCTGGAESAGDAPMTPMAVRMVSGETMVASGPGSGEWRNWSRGEGSPPGFGG